MSEKSLVDEIRELRKIFDEINILKSELETLKNSIVNLKIPSEEKIKEIIKCETENCLNRIFGDIETEIKNAITPEWLEKHLENCQDLDCKWCNVVFKHAKKLGGI